MSTELDTTGLTAEEIAALSEPDTEEELTATQGELEEKAKADGTNTTDEVKHDDENQPKPAGDDAGAAAAADDGATAAAPANQPEPAATAEPESGQPAGAAQQQAPILVAQAPADADAKLAEIATKKADILAKFDDGEITAREYQGQLDALAKQEREIERAIDKAQIAQDLEQQRQKNQWDADCNTFLTQHKDSYGGEANQEAFNQLNQTVIAFANMPMNRGVPGPELLARAHKAVMAMRGTPVVEAKADPKAAAKPAAPKPALPPDVSRLPSATPNDPAEGKWASLDRLRDAGNGIAYEEALSKMSKADRDAYLAA